MQLLPRFNFKACQAMMPYFRTLYVPLWPVAEVVVLAVEHVIIADDCSKFSKLCGIYLLVGKVKVTFMLLGTMTPGVHSTAIHPQLGTTLLL